MRLQIRKFVLYFLIIAIYFILFLLMGFCCDVDGDGDCDNCCAGQVSKAVIHIVILMLMVMILGMVKVTIFEMAMMIMMVMMTETSMVMMTATSMVMVMMVFDVVF